MTPFSQLGVEVAALELPARWSRTRNGSAVVLLALLLGACASSRSDRAATAHRPPEARDGPAAWAERDGPDAHPPSGLDSVPDAEPQLEPFRSGGPNKPYDALGQSYVPLQRDVPYTERGLATWYGRKFQGRRTSSGEPYDMYAMTAAHPTLPIPSYARVRNPANGREIVVRINDRGPFHSGRVIDLSYTAALKLGVLRGATPVEVQRITGDDIRTGAWRRNGPPAPAPGEPPPTLLASAAAAASSPQVVAAVAPAAVDPLPVGAVPTGPAIVLSTPEAAPAVAEAASPSPSPSTAAAVPGAAATPSPVPAHGYWLQLGAFRQRAGADSFSQKVAADADWLAPMLAVFDDSALFRLQAGPYASREDARGAAERLRSLLQLVPVVVARP